MRSMAILLPALVGGCISFSPTLYLYETRLTPIVQQDEEARLTREDGSVTFALEGLRIRVEPMIDEALDREFPDDSNKGFFSTNPYTYGDWIDPLLGYTPNRFTVFRVTVINDIYAKVLLDPLKPVLRTDRGEVMHSYGIPSFSPHQSFERYYRAIRGQSGNEFYRFDLRMGNVRSKAYLEDVRVFKGESYAGFLAFDSLSEDVAQVQLELKEFVLKFDASGQPIETIDIVLDFDRHIGKSRKMATSDDADGGEG